MNCNAWTAVLAGAGMVSLPAAAWADEKPRIEPPTHTGIQAGYQFWEGLSA